MKHPFKITRGGQGEPTPPVPTKFAQFDNKRLEGEQYAARFLARRENAIQKERAKLANQQ
ncbi:hypothetical protein [Spirosoma radiotolerans]|uniref:Uncharacterized protein n=1 Tax=Spirosoma radiotolerans TaxID=1379870 RepID=A0A0E3ZS96_9BACT|nr:hypothetical protein [Spirosoma radiotolerans]AKD54028.1 hypothetical protein SD10_03030 [Spirosoma radiotolerans]